MFKTQKIVYNIELVYTRKTYVEVFKNIISERYLLTKLLNRSKIKLLYSDFSEVKYENDSDKVFKLSFNIEAKDSDVFEKKLERFISDELECKDFKIVKNNTIKKTSTTQNNVNNATSNESSSSNNNSNNEHSYNTNQNQTSESDATINTTDTTSENENYEYKGY